MGTRYRIVAAGALAALLLACLTPAPAWAGGHDDGGATPSPWTAWLGELLRDLWPAPDALVRVIGREGLSMDPDGTPVPGSGEGSSAPLDGDPGLSTLIGREGPCMDPDGTPALSCTEGATAPASGTTAPEPPPGS